MSEWDFDGPEGTNLSSGPERNRRAGTGGSLNLPMTAVCLLAVAAVSFAVAWIMKDRVRDFAEMGLTFAAPFAALMVSSMLVEQATGRMTPQCSRKAQLVCMLVTVAVAFLVGCLAEVLHQPVILERTEPEYDYLLVLDKSGSMVFTDLDEPCREAVHELLDAMEDGNNVGIVAFGTTLSGRESIRPLDEEQREKIGQVIDIPIEITEETNPLTGSTSYTGDGTNFSVAMDGAISLTEEMAERNRTVRIILVTDGDREATGSFRKLETWAAELNGADPEHKQVELCAVQLGETPMLDMVKDAVRSTGGTIYDNVDVTELAAQLQSLKNTLVIPEPVDTLKATYEGQTADGKPNTPYMILTCVLLVLLGVLSGVSLKIMYSVVGQFRVQTILSPLMGLAAFLLLNYGRMIGAAPAWFCEALAFSLFGLVLMRDNRNTGTFSPNRKPAPAGKTGRGRKTAIPAQAEDEDF